jgi:hypothetical protein
MVIVISLLVGLVKRGSMLVQAGGEGQFVPIQHTRIVNHTVQSGQSIYLGTPIPLRILRFPNEGHQEDSACFSLMTKSSAHQVEDCPCNLRSFTCRDCLHFDMSRCVYLMCAVVSSKVRFRGGYPRCLENKLTHMY